MSEALETADSGFDMDAGVSELSGDLFGSSTQETGHETGQEVSQESNQELDEDLDLEGSGDENANQKLSHEPGQESEQVRTAPASWKKEMHEAWGTLTPEIQEYIETREAQMKEGLEKDRGDANLGRIMRDVMTPYSPMLKQMGLDEPTMVRNLLSAHYRLSTAPQEERNQLFNQLAQSYGIKTGQEQEQVDPVVKRLQDELNSIKSSLSARDQATLQEARSRVEKEVEAFASDPKHQFFDEVSEDLVVYLNAGASLEDAYEKAVWANPVTRQKEIDRLNKEKETSLREKAKQETAQAKKAKSANVKSRDTHKAPTGPAGTMEDTMRETLREIQNRN